MLIFLKLEEIICFYHKMNCLRIFLLMIWDCVLKQWILKSNMRTKHEKIKKFFWMWYFIFHLLQNNSTFFPAAASALPISSSPLRESLLYTLPGRTEKKFGTKRIRPGSYSWYSQRLLMEFILSDIEMESAAAYAVLDLLSIPDLDISDALFGVFYGRALQQAPPLFEWVGCWSYFNCTSFSRGCLSFVQNLGFTHL